MNSCSYLKPVGAAVVVSLFTCLHAGEVTWCGPDGGSWDDTNNWTGDVPPMDDDTAVFDPGAGNELTVKFNQIQDVCGVKVLSGTVTLGTEATSGKYLRLNADENGVSEVYVAEGATNVIRCGYLPAVAGASTFRKTGAGVLGMMGPLGDSNGWIPPGGRKGYALIDVAGGVIRTLTNGNLSYATNMIVRTGATWGNYGYNTMMYGEPRVYLEEGAEFRTFDKNDLIGGLEGRGLLRGYSGSGAASITLKYGPCRFDGQIGTSTTAADSFTLNFSAQGTMSDEQYQFIVGNTNVINYLSQITYNDEPSPRAVTNCPIRFAAGIGRFNFFVLNCKQDAPLFLEDVAGVPVDVYALNLGDCNGTYKNVEKFAVTGRGNFYVGHEPGGWRRWIIPFTNDCLRSTGAVGSYSVGTAQFGDGTEGHDPDLSTVASVVAKDADSKVVFANSGPLTVPALEINGVLTHNAGAGTVTVAGPVTGTGTMTLNATNVFNGAVSGVDMTINEPATFNGPVSGGSHTVNAETVFEGAVDGGAYTINAATTFAGAVKDGSFTVRADTEFRDRAQFASLSAKAPVTIGTLVSSEDAKVSFTMSTNLVVGAGGGEAWLSSVNGEAPNGGEVLFTNGWFHGAYIADAYTSTGLMIPGPMYVHYALRVVDAELWLHNYSSSTKKIAVGPGGRLYGYDNASRNGSVLTLDGGEYYQYLRQSYGHDSLLAENAAHRWDIYVTERGGLLSEKTWRPRGGTYVRPNLTAYVSSGAALDRTTGPLTLSFSNQITIRHPLDLDGDVILDSGYYQFSAETDATNALHVGTMFGTGDLTLGGVCINLGDRAVDLEPKFAADGQKLRLAGAAAIMARKGSNGAQTITFGDGVSSPFVREKGAALALLDYKASVHHIDGTGPKFYVAGAKAELDPNTHVLKDPVFGASYSDGGSGIDFFRYGFLTQGNDGLLTEDLSLYTEGVTGGANTIGRVSVDPITLSENAQVAGLLLDARALTIAEGATLKVGHDDTEHPATVIMRLTDGWDGAVKYGNLLGVGTLDFGASEGLFVIGRAARQNYAVQLNASIAGSGGVSYVGFTAMNVNGGKVKVGGGNTYTGGTRIDGVQVKLTSAGALSTGPVYIRGGDYNGGRVRFSAAATYANEWFVRGNGCYMRSDNSLESGCLVFNADATLTGDVHVDRSARFSTSPYETAANMNYSDYNTAGTGVFAGEISGGEVQIIGAIPAGYERKAIVFTHANSYTGGTVVAGQDLVLRGDGDCGTGKVALGSGAKLVFENTAEKTFANRLDGIGTVKLAGTAPVHLPNINRESWCDLKLDLADTNPVMTEIPAFSSITNSAETGYATFTLTDDCELPEGIEFDGSKVNLVLDGATLDLGGAELTVRRLVSQNGGRAVNGTLTELKPQQGFLIIVH